MASIETGLCAAALKGAAPISSPAVPGHARGPRGLRRSPAGRPSHGWPREFLGINAPNPPTCWSLRQATKPDRTISERSRRPLQPEGWSDRLLRPEAQPVPERDRQDHDFRAVKCTCVLERSDLLRPSLQGAHLSQILVTNERETGRKTPGHVERDYCSDRQPSGGTGWPRRRTWPGTLRRVFRGNGRSSQASSPRRWQRAGPPALAWISSEVDDPGRGAGPARALSHSRWSRVPHAGWPVAIAVRDLR